MSEMQFSCLHLNTTDFLHFKFHVLWFKHANVPWIDKLLKNWSLCQRIHGEQDNLFLLLISLFHAHDALTCMCELTCVDAFTVLAQRERHNNVMKSYVWARHWLSASKDSQRDSEVVLRGIKKKDKSYEMLWYLLSVSLKYLLCFWKFS